MRPVAPAFAIAIALVLAATPRAEALTLFSQSFEHGASAGWGFTSQSNGGGRGKSPVFGSGPGSGPPGPPGQAGKDGGGAARGNAFWKMDDQAGPGGRADHWLAFERVDLTGFADVTLRFSYRFTGSGRPRGRSGDLYYVINGQRVSLLGDLAAGAQSTDGWVTLTLEIPDDTGTLDFALGTEQSGGTTSAGFDEVTLSGDLYEVSAPQLPAVPLPAGLVLLGSAVAIVGLRRLI